MQVGVRVEEEDMLTGARHHCCSAYLTFVSVMARPGPGRAATPLPKIAPGTQHQREIFRAGQSHAWASMGVSFHSARGSTKQVAPAWQHACQHACQPLTNTTTVSMAPA